MRAGGLLLALGLLACAPQDSAQLAEQNYQACVHVSLPPQRLRACSAVISDASAPAPRRVEALIARGGVRAESAQHVRAIADLGRALRLEPDNVEALLRRAALHQQRGALEAAIRDYDAVLRLQPGLQAAAQRREEALVGMGLAFENQMDELNQLIAQSPRNAALLNNRCWLRGINGHDLEQALADCDESLRLAPGEANVLDSRGLVNYKLGRYAAALADYDAALASEPGRAHYMYGRGVTLIALGREEEGRAAMQQAVQLDARVANLYASYGVGR